MKKVLVHSLAAILAAAAGAAFGAAPAANPQAGQNQAAPAAPRSAQAPAVGAPKVNIPLHVGNDPEQIADDDTVITQIIPLEYASAVDVVNTLAAVVKPETPMVAANNCVIVTEASCVVKRIVQITAYLDERPVNDNVIAVVRLHGGDAAEAARQVNAVFGSQKP